MRAEETQSGVFIIPANSVVTVEGDVSSNERFVKVRYQDQTLKMFVMDLLSRGEPTHQAGKSMWG